MLDVQKVYGGMRALNPVMLELLPVALIDKGPKLYFLNVEKLSISPKPHGHWSV
jgi:hypothetical protein